MYPKSELQTLLEDVAQTVVAKTREAFPLGSSNISYLHYDKRSAKHCYFSELYYYYQQHTRSLEALIDMPYKDLAMLRIVKTRLCNNTFGAGSSSIDVLKASESKAANCDMMRLFVFSNIQKLYADNLHLIRPEMVSLSRVGILDPRYRGKEHYYFDHGCIIIGRTKGDSDWRTWNHEAIIVDPWIGRWFYATRLHHENPWKNSVLPSEIRFNIRMSAKENIQI